VADLCANQGHHRHTCQNVFPWRWWQGLVSLQTTEFLFEEVLLLVTDERVRSRVTVADQGL
jgi:hypothetical protein